MEFDGLPAAGDSIGIEIELPNSKAGDTTGLGWELNADGTYTGVSYYWDNTEEDYYVDSTWVCDAVPSSRKPLYEDGVVMKGYCYNFMPAKNVSGPDIDYRFSTWDKPDFYGWTFFN